MKKLEAKTLDIIVPTNLALNRFETYLNDCPLPVSFNKDIDADAIILSIDIKTGKTYPRNSRYEKYIFRRLSLRPIRKIITIACNVF